MHVRTTRDLAALIRGSRMRQSMTQDELARASGLSRRTIGDLESARTTPRFGALLALCEALDIDIELSPRSKSNPARDTSDDAIDLDALLEGSGGDE